MRQVGERERGSESCIYRTSEADQCSALLKGWIRRRAGHARRRLFSSEYWCSRCCCVVLCCAVLCCAVLCCAVLCCAVLCCAVLCCAVLFCAVGTGLCCMDGLD
ncbi:hypothetical protein F4824DRAFT_456495, partial [Ustulina deusta]